MYSEGVWIHPDVVHRPCRLRLQVENKNRKDAFRLFRKRGEWREKIEKLWAH
jgi:hypothetical protein